MTQNNGNSCTLIINPTSGKYSEVKVRQIVTTLVAHGFEPQVLLTQGPDDAARFARQICENHPDPLIIAGGGDGTINGVVNGLLPGSATIAVLPLGTANVLAKEIGITSIDDAVQRIIRGKRRSLPVGLVTGEGIERYFLLMTGIGFDARVVESVRPGEKKTLKQGAYLLSALRCLLSWERDEMYICADNKNIYCHSAIVCNAASYGGSFRLVPNVDLFTPGFEIVCVTADTRTAVMRLAAATVLGMHTNISDTHRLATRSLTISGRKPVQIDGDFCGYTPLKIEAVADFARLIV